MKIEIPWLDAELVERILGGVWSVSGVYVLVDGVKRYKPDPLPLTPIYTYPEDCYWPATTPVGQWIDWHGGECPIPEDKEFQIRYRRGLRWDHREPSDQKWGGDIVAYRLLP